MKGKRVMLEGGKEEKKRRGGEVILKRERERTHTSGRKDRGGW